MTRTTVGASKATVRVIKGKGNVKSLRAIEVERIINEASMNFEENASLIGVAGGASVERTPLNHGSTMTVINQSSVITTGLWLVHGTQFKRISPQLPPLGRPYAPDQWNEAGRERAEKAFGIKPRTIDWRGNLDGSVRADGSFDLASEIALHLFHNPDSHIHIVGYSHGGNVAIGAINILAEHGRVGVVDTPVTIGTPVRRDYQISSNTSVGQHINVFNVFDNVQVLGTGFQPYTASQILLDLGRGFDYIGRVFSESSNVINIEASVTRGNRGPQASHSYMHNNPRIWNEYIIPFL